MLSLTPAAIERARDGSAHPRASSGTHGDAHSVERSALKIDTRAFQRRRTNSVGGECASPAAEATQFSPEHIESCVGVSVWGGGPETSLPYAV